MTTKKKTSKKVAKKAVKKKVEKKVEAKKLQISKLQVIFPSGVKMDSAVASGDGCLTNILPLPILTQIRDHLNAAIVNKGAR